MQRLWLNLVLVLSLLAPNLVLAQADRAILPPIPGGTSDVPFGEVQKMTALLRGNGETVVLMRHAFANTAAEDKEQTTLALTIPSGVELKELKAYQLILPPICLQYDYTSGKNTCLQTGEPDYTSDYFYSDQGQSTYFALTPTIEGNKLSLPLAKPVSHQKYGAVILNFRTPSLTKESWGKFWSYRVTSFGAEEELAAATIGVDVDTDLYLKGKKSSLNYATPTVGLASDTKESGAAGFSSSRFDQVVQTIGQGAITKTAKLLAPSETLTAHGSYAASQFRLHADIFGWILLVLIILLALTRRSFHDKRPLTPAFSYWTEVWTGLAVALAVTGYAYLVYVLQLNQSGYYGVSPFGGLLTILSTLIYLALLAGPVVWAGMKRGWQAGLIMLIAEVVWVSLAVAVMFLLVDPGQPIITPLGYPAAISSSAGSAESLK